MFASNIANPELAGNVVLFKKTGMVQISIPATPSIRLGLFCVWVPWFAAIDDHIDPEEVSVLEQIISADSQLAAIEKKSLHAYLHWRLNTKVNMNGLKARLECINSREKSAISHILVCVALADGTIDPAEIKQLEKLYTSLGLDKAMVSSDIHNLTSAKPKASPAEEKFLCQYYYGIRCQLLSESRSFEST